MNTVQMLVNLYWYFTYLRKHYYLCSVSMFDILKLKSMCFAIWTMNQRLNMTLMLWSYMCGKRHAFSTFFALVRLIFGWVITFEFIYGFWIVWNELRKRNYLYEITYECDGNDKLNLIDIGQEKMLIEENISLNTTYVFGYYARNNAIWFLRDSRVTVCDINEHKFMHAFVWSDVVYLMRVLFTTGKRLPEYLKGFCLICKTFYFKRNMDTRAIS